MINQRLNGQIAARSIFFGAETGNAYPFAVNQYLHCPRTISRRYATVFRQSVFIGARNIMQICRTAHIAQIAKTVVCSIAIYVVDMILRPFSSHVQPRQPMFGNGFFADKNSTVSITHLRASALTYPVRLVFALQPCENARVGVIMDKLTQFFCGNWHNTSVSVGPFCDGDNRNGNLFSGATLAARRGI